MSLIRGERLLLDGLSLRLDASEILILTGPNGAGKSTLLRCIAGLRKADAGTIRRHGAVSWLGHQDALKPGLTLEENLLFFARPGGKSLPETLERLDLAPLAALPARLLSSGQKRRAAFARVMLSPAPLWLLDEPGVGLDDASVTRLCAIAAEHRAAGGSAIITTHTPLPLDGARRLSLQGQDCRHPS